MMHDTCLKTLKAHGLHGQALCDVTQATLVAQLLYASPAWSEFIQEAQLMLTTGSTRLAVSRGQQTWYHSTCNI